MNGVSSPWASKPRLGLIGNPENRRILAFQDAVQSLGLPRPLCLAYEELLSNPEALDRFEVDLLRIESPGENESVARSLISRGGGPSHPGQELGEISFLREYHRGFLQRAEMGRTTRCFVPQCTAGYRSHVR
jgi:hypothetical protein